MNLDKVAISEFFRLKIFLDSRNVDDLMNISKNQR